MSPITKEFTKEQLQQIIETDHVQCGEASALSRIALASLEAEDPWRNPVLAYADSYRDMAKRGVESIPVWSVITDLERNIAPLYTAPPAPVSVPDEDLLHMAASAIDDLLSNKDRSGAGVWADIPAKLRRTAMLQGAEPVSQPCTLREGVAAIRNSGIAIDDEKIKAERDALNEPTCWCHTCRPVTVTDMRFIVCPDCGNKRCPHANDHRNACTGSNEPGQEGSAYPAAPQQEVTQALAKGMERYGDAMQKLADSGD